MGPIKALEYSRNSEETSSSGWESYWLLRDLSVALCPKNTFHYVVSP